MLANLVKVEKPKEAHMDVVENHRAYYPGFNMLKYNPSSSSSVVQSFL